MDNQRSERGLDASATLLTIDHELDLVESAIELVLGGSSRRVTLAGLRFGREILRHPISSRFTNRVRLEPLWRFDGSGCDIAVTTGG
jgi:hypothetical protein